MTNLLLYIQQDKRDKGEIQMAKYRILETERLYLRELCQKDFPALCMILQDEKTMYAYEGAF